MFSFKYFTPTKVVFGKDTEGCTGKLVKEFGDTFRRFAVNVMGIEEKGLMKKLLLTE